MSVCECVCIVCECVCIVSEWCVCEYVYISGNGAVVTMAMVTMAATLFCQFINFQYNSLQYSFISACSCSF